MKVVVAIDSFKGSMTSMQAGSACRDGILAATEAEVIVKPLADGGEGTVQALVEGLGGTYEYVTVTGPMGNPVKARYGILENKTAVMEMAEASGITLVKGNPNPWRATSVGVGEMIMDAVKKGCREFIIGIGGSATTEGGIGMLCALGYEFFDKKGNKLPPFFSSLAKVSQVKRDNVAKELSDCHFQIACDVKNPLCGPEGSVFVFGPQKGVKEEEKEQMDAAMRAYAACLENFVGIERDNKCGADEGKQICSMPKTHALTGECSDISETYVTGKQLHNIPGAGAAGGLGFAFLWGLQNVRLKPGIDIVLEAVGFNEELKNTDIVVTGEGCLDFQTAMGKAPVGVAQAAKQYGCKVIAFAGGMTEDAKKCNEKGIDAFFSILPGVCTLEEAMCTGTAQKNMKNAAEQVFRLIKSPLHPMPYLL